MHYSIFTNHVCAQAFILRKEECVDMLDEMAILLLLYTAAAITVSAARDVF